MQRIPESWLVGVLGLGMLSVPLVHCAWARLAARTHAPASPSARMPQRRPPAPRSQFERLIQEAERWHMRAWQAEGEERYAVETWDPAAAASLGQAAWRRELLADDRSGNLRHARVLAREAEAQAGTPAQQYQAALLAALLACEAGDHQAERREVQVLARLAPRSWITRLCVRHAAEHSRR